MFSRKQVAVMAPTRALVRPAADFWLLGGLSALVLGLCWVLTDKLGYKLEDPSHGWAATAAFWVNYPHFAFSYQLFYPGFLRRLRSPETTLTGKGRLVIAGVLVPVFMVAYFVYAWQSQDPKYLGWAVFAMAFTVGWHYVKQGYGALITEGVYRGVFYGEWEKRLLWGNAYAVWLYTFARVNNGGTQPYYDVSYQTLPFPDWVVTGSLWLCGATTLATAAVLLKHWLHDRKGISVNAVVGYTSAIYLWVLFPYMNNTFYIWIPLFHSLQYLPFVFKYKKSEYKRAIEAPEGNAQRTRLRTRAKFLGFTALAFALGAGFFWYIPNYIDDQYWVFDLDPHFFLIAFITFINVHHFFIDAAFWRRDNTDVQRRLFRA